ncbi:MAG: hypothetical protein IBX60_02555 [Candidatus Aminicenantes bacterium]|nr:hypothetical protein [Candidatus Aminicenantes bacterium]
MKTQNIFIKILIIFMVLEFSFTVAFAGKIQVNRTGTELGLTQELFKNIEWRNIGPANMVGRITDIECVPGDMNIVYVGTASGGVWKSTNGGVTWTPIFENQGVASIGDIALEPGNPEVIYVGTGESNVRNSVSFGNGVYKSTDGGKTWQLLGLRDTRHISRIVINPKNPEIVYVGALGHAFGPNKERGVFRSINGGKTWTRVLYKDEFHGVADMDIDPQNPNIVYAALWRFERKPWTFLSGDEKGGVYKSVDGGQSWERLEEGLPKLVGRIGIKVSRSNPNVVYAITESKEGTLYRSDNKGETFRMVSKDVEIVSRGFYYTDIRVDPADENRVYAVSSRLQLSIDGGKTFKRISSSTHVDFHALWIDPLEPRRMWQGQDGGVAVSYDRGKTWEYVNNFPVGQFYQIYADNREPFYYVGGGLQDNGTWYGPNRTREPFGILNDDWRMISFGDGFHIVVHPDDPELFLSESQAGNVMRTNMRTREQQNVSPQPRRADGAPVSALKYRFNWNTPLVISPHDANTVYVGGNVVFKSKDFGSTWEIISPDLTTNDPEKQKTAGGPAWPENTTAEYHCTIISLAESPVQPGVLWAGTDDGNLLVSKNGGETWENVVSNVPRVPSFSPVSHVQPSYKSAGKAYCSFDRHMLDDFHPYVFMTTDFGQTWVDITGDLPVNAYVWVLREDPKNPNIIYAGTELGLFASFYEGKNWVRLHLKNLPTVAVHDILIHKRDNDLILGTHGRSLWILDDISFLQNIQKEILAQNACLFPMRPALRFATKPTRYGIGDKVFRGQNPPYGALITYYLKENVEKEDIRIEILDESGQMLRRLKRVPYQAGVNRISWDLRYEGPRPRKEIEFEEDFFSRASRGPQVLPGRYIVRLTFGEEKHEEPVEVKLDSTVNTSIEDLRTQLSLSLQIRDMQSFVNDALRALDILQDQLNERKQTLEKQKDSILQEAIDVIEEHIENIDSIQNQLVRPEGTAFWSDGPRLLDRLNRLFGAIDGVNTAPTKAQISYFNELKQEFGEAMEIVNTYLRKTAKKLNDALRKHKVPELFIPKQVSVPKK